MRNKTLVLLLVALLALSGWALHQRFEFVTETVDLGPGELARRDPLLAARRFLQALGVRAGARDHLPRDAELRDEGTLIVGEAGEVLTAGQAQLLLDWVADGGHLIVAASATDEDEPTPLLAPFGVVRREAARSPDAEAAPDVAARLAELLEAASGAAGKKAEDAPDDQLAELAFDGAATRVRVHFDPRYILAETDARGEDGADGWPRRLYVAGSAAGTHFAQYEWGDGMVSVMSDLRPWHNARIGLYDHALLLRVLVDLERPVLVLHGARVPDLFELIGRHGREPVLAAALCLLAWLLYRTHRFGPLRADEEGVRRALGEHILAASRYRWRHAGGHAVLRGARDAVLERARRRLPDLPQGDAQTQAAALEEHTGLPAEDIRQALLIDPGRDAAALQAAATRLQSLWKRL